MDETDSSIVHFSSYVHISCEPVFIILAEREFKSSYSARGGYHATLG